MIAADKFIMDRTIVATRLFSITLAFKSPIIPRGTPTISIRALPATPMSSSNPSRKLEFKIFVGIILQQMTNGFSDTNINSNQKILSLVAFILLVMSKALFFTVINLYQFKFIF